jgi:hypothetical protein
MKKSKFITLVLILSFININSTFSKNSFSENITWGTTAQLSYGKKYNESLFSDFHYYFTLKAITTGVLVQYNLSRKVDIESGLLLSGQRVSDTRGILAGSVVEPFENHTKDHLFAKILLVAKYYPSKNEEKKLLPVVDIGIRPGFVLAGVERIYEDIWGNHLASREYYSIFSDKNIYGDRIYMDIILGAGVMLHLPKLKISCGIYVPLRLFSYPDCFNFWTQVKPRSVAIMTSVFF